MVSVAGSSLAVALATTPRGEGSASVRDLKLAANGKKIPTQTEPARVAVVEDDNGAREAFAFQLNTAGFKTVTYGSAREFLEVSDATSFECVLADIYLPEMSGLELQRELSRTVPWASIVFVTGYGDLSVAMNTVRNGAVDFLEKPVDDEALLTSITRAVDLSRLRHAEHVRRRQLEEQYGSLTPREREVFVLITGGLSNKQVGATLKITERTIKAHRGQVMSKMSATSLADLVRMAAMLGIHPIQTQPEQIRQ